MDYLFHIATMMIWYIILVQAINIYLGYTNILALSHVAFAGIGAYSGALITLNGGSVWMGFLVGGFIAAILGFIVGLSSISLDADYLGIATLGFAQIVSSVFQNWTSLTRGPLGLPGIPRPSLFGFSLNSTSLYFFFTFFIGSILMFLMWRMIKSPYGRVLETIREDETAARSLGINTNAYKLQVFVIGSVMAAFVGVLMAHHFRYIDPNSFRIGDMGLILTMLVVGGMGTFRGPFIGVALIILIQEGVTFLNLPAQYVGSLQLLLYSLTFLIILIYAPQGIGGFWKHRKRQRKQFTRY